MYPVKKTLRFILVGAYFALMAPCFALLALIAEDIANRVLVQEIGIPSFSNYAFVLQMYWPSTVYSCVVPATVSGYLYAAFLASQQDSGRRLRLNSALLVAALLGMVSGATAAWPQQPWSKFAVTGAIASTICAAMLWMFGLRNPNPR